MSSLDFFADLNLSPEELRDAKAFVEFRRKVRAMGYRPLIAATKGNKTKLLEVDTPSVTDFVNEIVKSDIFAAATLPDLKAKAKLRGLKTRQTMLNYQGSPWKSDLVAEYLQITVQMVSRKRRNQQLLGLTYGKKEYIYPCWQFTNDGILSGLDLTLSALESEDVPDWDKLRFFTNPDERLNSLTPIEVLQQGDSEEVIDLAKVYGIQQS